MTTQPPGLRAAPPQAIQLAQLGLLAELPGTWQGSGFNLISKPGFSVDPPQPFVLQVNTTKETLTFTQIGGAVPDRGSQQPDITIFGLTYEQQITDATAVPTQLLHVETGMWIALPGTLDPTQPQPIVRLATIPHGDSVLAQGSAQLFASGPLIQPISAVPFDAVTGQPTPPGYFPPDPMAFPHVDPFPIPAGFDLSNPNAALTSVIQGQTIPSTVVLEVSTDVDPSAFPTNLGGTYGGSILNIPFVTANANAVSLEAKFWIETVEQSGGLPFLQLQYSQRVILSFPALPGPVGPNNPLINWPHISVATLTKV